mmetsp:Transcript_45664/g.97288  ORF Transcript_45664/g.97288 Transcript_45664/m.97288 type:complete len:185 (-) Transcript_45664:244-798(-)
MTALLSAEQLGPLFELELTPSAELSSRLACALAYPAGDAAADSAISNAATCSIAQRRSIEALFSAAKLRGLSAEELEASLVGLGLAAAVAAALVAAWVESGSAVQAALLTKAFSARKLLDVEWTFGVTACSSEHTTIGSTYVQMRMTVEADGGATEYLHLELSLAKFYDFLHELESARAQLDVV